MKKLRSAAVVAKLLDAEGFNDHCQAAAEKYWKRSLMDRQKERKIKKLEKEFSELIQGKCDMKERLLIGRFISLHKRMAFDVGLNIGIMAFAAKQDKEVEGEATNDLSS